MNKTPLRYLAVILAGAALVCGCGKKKEEPAPQDAVPAQEVQAPKADEPSNVQEDQKAAARDDAPSAGPAAAVPGDGVRAHEAHEYRVIAPVRAGLGENPLLAGIPDSSFFTFASAGSFALDRPDVEDFFRHVSTIVMDSLGSVSDSDLTEPYQKATAALFRGMFKSFSPQKLRSLGIMGDSSPQFAFFFVRQTPVFKFALDDAAKFRQIVESYWEQHKVEAHRAESVSTQWSLVKIDDDETAELAVRWDERSLTVTVVGDDVHASQLLPELMMLPFEGHTAASQLAGVRHSKDAAAVGVFDFNGLLNQLVQAQEIVKKLTGEPDAELPKECVKDLRRIATSIPKVGFQAELVSGGSVMGVDLKLMFEVKGSAWIGDLLKWKPKAVSLARPDRMPMAEGYAAIPSSILMKGLKAIAADLKREPFQCEPMTELNDIAELDAQLADEDFKPYEALTKADHYVSAATYSESMDSAPLLASFVLHSDHAALIASALELVHSDKFNAQMSAGADGSGTEPAPAPDAGVAGIAPEPVELVYDDAKVGNIRMENEPGFVGFTALLTSKKFVMADRMLFDQAKAAELRDVPSLVHIMLSEGMIAEDKDVSRDYMIGADISAGESSIDLTVRYAIK